LAASVTPQERDDAEEALEALARWVLTEGRERIARGERVWRIEAWMAMGADGPRWGGGVRRQSGEWRASPDNP
jgi:hypothetical protein